MSILALLQASAPESVGVSALQLDQRAVNFQGLPPNVIPPGVMLEGPIVSPYALLAQTSQPQLGNMPQQFEGPVEMTDNQLLGLSSVNVLDAQKAPVVNVEATHGTIDLEDDMLAKPEDKQAANTDRPPAQANAQLSNQMYQGLNKKKKAAATVKAKGQAIQQKNNEIRNKITMLEGQIKREENLARKLKGDQINLKAKEQMTDIEAHLDKQLNALRNDLKISGQEAKLARLRAEQAVISQKIKGIPAQHDDKKAKKRSLKKHAKVNNSLAVSSTYLDEALAEEEEEEAAAEEEAAEEPAEEVEEEEEPAAEEEAAEEPEAEEEAPAEPAAPAAPAAAAAPAATEEQKARDEANDAKTQELLDASKKMMEQSEAMQESLKKVEATVAANAAAPKTADEIGGSAPLNGWDAVKKYFKGEQGVPKAKKFVKFLNLLTQMDESDEDFDDDDE